MVSEGASNASELLNSTRGDFAIADARLSSPNIESLNGQNSSEAGLVLLRLPQGDASHFSVFLEFFYG